MISFPNKKKLDSSLCKKRLFHRFIVKKWYLFCLQGNQHNRSVMLNSKVIDYINFILRAGEFKNCDASQVKKGYTSVV